MTMTATIERARALAETVTDPELPMLTLADLGVLRAVDVVGGRVVVSITPTYTGCPALDAMRDDLVHTLQDAGYADVEVRTVLRPAWSTDWISAEGRRKLANAGIAPPGRAPRRPGGPVPLTLGMLQRCSGTPEAGGAPDLVNVPDAVSTPGAVSTPEAGCAPDRLNVPDTVSTPEAGGAPDLLNAPDVVSTPHGDVVRCPQCGSADTEETSRFCATACTALWRCRTCLEPFERVKEI